MRAGGLGFVLFARFQPDTPGKLAAHAYSYEHLELASYELLRRIAQAAGDRPAAELALQIGAEEQAMGERLARNFDRTTSASLAGGDARERLPAYLADAHAIEAQSITLLARALKIVHEPQLVEVFDEHLALSQEQMRLLEERMHELGARPTFTKDAAMRLGAINWGTFFHAQPDTPGKLAAFAFAFEHLEVAAYEHLHRAAEAAGEPATALLAEAIEEQERAAAQTMAHCFDAAANASLGALGAP